MSYANGLFGCMSDFGICCFTAFCPCITQARNVAAIRKQECGICHCINIYSEFYIRNDLRKSSGEQSNDVMDCFAGYCCMPCAICQDARALGSGVKIEGLT